MTSDSRSVARRGVKSGAIRLRNARTSRALARGADVAAVRVASVAHTDWSRLRALPWGMPLDEWPEHGVQPLSVRRGESRHPVLFVQVGHRRYAIKETSPEAAEHEITVLRDLGERGCRTLEPVGYVVVRGEPIEAGEVAGRPVYISGDIGYCVTRLAERVLPQSVLYRYPFTDANKRLLWSAVAELLLDLHEAGAYWGDPSLANVLMDLSGQRLTAVMADAETAELVSGPLGEGMRQQDVEAFVESLQWQAEDIRLARGLSEEQHLVTAGDADYFRSRYRGLRAERARTQLPSAPLYAHALDLQQQMRQLNALGYGVLQLVQRSTRAIQAGWAEGAATLGTSVPRHEHVDWNTATLRPGWYVRRLRELLGVRVPRAYAQRLYQHLLIHKWLLSERAGHDVGMDAAADDWLTRYQQPAQAFLAAYAPEASADTAYATVLSILDLAWEMSKREQRAVSFEEAAVAFALAQAPSSPLSPDGQDTTSSAVPSTAYPDTA
jgi:hypothetical protein